MTDEINIERFVDVQENTCVGFEIALAEIEPERKMRQWIW